ncbi:lipopolysaccharide assembly protein LapB [Snodgrassella communis]|jgi:lipopolysaccharide assembly protein B|uniref:Lipopolysaccharide assembly protein B n=1 Tax=Snodgrassella communis TaxID=2946699 RepID=A0A066TD06_9NEIS|nr:lipopolysaccharide assembly protein LapB [Snodgrassella communis]KDN12981.1 Heat shock (predicted periplasmic) protein YciM, precursor [Snodgrassella communis]KDN14107.1 Heat shock (predicted periplasmic) protein YciM, precursor [Snodgrassella communis]PIT11484.1 lipopolysaccharide assembly protein LapB [Snodgrassella communis]PIT26901.1 lipopolysaccharide assembly protein LapB [Snodgrassella communis]PIT29680.1 lipopolysaccharide assembly protein LapB [Snodgrassella communis]
MDSNDFWMWLAPVILLPVFFAMGWFAARVDMRAVLKQAKAIPDGFYKSLDALVERKSAVAVRELAEVVDQQNDARQSTYELHLTLGKLYRQRGENDKAIALHQSLLQLPETIAERRDTVAFELGQDYQAAGLVDRAEQILVGLLSGSKAKQARQILLNIYQQDRDWEKAIKLAEELSTGDQTYQFEIAQFYCELAQLALYQSEYNKAREYIFQALAVNRKCSRANMIMGDVELKQQNYQAAIDAYSAIEKQNYEYLSLVGERLYDAYDGLQKAADGIEVLIGFAQTFPQLDLSGVIYEKSLPVFGEDRAREIVIDLVRRRPTLTGAYRLLGVLQSNINPKWKVDVDMMRSVVGMQMQKSVMYRCRHCHFKSQVYFWHCPACNKWETFTPNRIDV